MKISAPTSAKPVICPEYWAGGQVSFDALRVRDIVPVTRGSTCIVLLEYPDPPRREYVAVSLGKSELLSRIRLARKGAFA